MSKQSECLSLPWSIVQNRWGKDDYAPRVKYFLKFLNSVLLKIFKKEKIIRPLFFILF